MSKKFLDELILIDDPKEFLKKIAFSTREEIWDIKDDTAERAYKIMKAYPELVEEIRNSSECKEHEKLEGAKMLIKKPNTKDVWWDGTEAHNG